MKVANTDPGVHKYIKAICYLLTTFYKFHITLEMYAVTGREQDYQQFVNIHSSSVQHIREQQRLYLVSSQTLYCLCLGLFGYLAGGLNKVWLRTGLNPLFTLNLLSVRIPE